MKTAPACKHQASPHSHRSTSGMTLVEVCIGLFIFTLVAAGVLSSLVQTRRMSIAAIYESNALITAEGYIEQMRSIPYETLIKCRKDSAAIENIPTVTATGIADSLTPSSSAAATINGRKIDIFGRYTGSSIPSGAPDVMDMRIAVTITRLTTVADDQRMLIKMDYSWTTPGVLSHSYNRASSLSLVRCNLKSFVN